MRLTEIVTKLYNRQINQCTNEELYCAIAYLIDKSIKLKNNPKGGKKLYYICAEFLVGKLLANNLVNLGMYDMVKQELKNCGKSIADIEELETEPSLGNGGLGRLAACFMDSIATLGLNGDGVGLLYHFGLFRQVFEQNKQTEHINPWIDNSPFIHATDKCYKINFASGNLYACMYDMDIVGYGGNVSKLHLFDIKSVDESVVQSGIKFDKKQIDKNLSLFLYPDDSDNEGKLLRLYQQYFMVSAAAQMIIDECVESGCNLYDLNDYAVIQLNDTHPTLIIPELVRLLVDRGIEINTAIDVVSKTCAYTNHTILAEALEKWDVSFMKKVAPDVYEIIEYMDKLIRTKFTDKSVYIIEDNVICMAYMAIHFCFSINGVAKLHTEILKNNELNNFYTIYPQKFNNMTNGITFRRWLLECNPELAMTIKSYIGGDFIQDASHLEQLKKHSDDAVLLNKLINIKHNNKIALKNYAKKMCNTNLDENSVFDVQIKRLHEYKRQQLNALYIIYMYNRIKNGFVPKRPITFIFGAKAAPSYVIAKDIIHLILCLKEVINNDNDVNKYINIFFAENYNVTYAEKIIPACDISEQISLASKEASGTGNMKLMLNGAVTLGTLDGANVEINNLVGDDNIYIFGKDSRTVLSHYDAEDYNPRNIYDTNDLVKLCVDFITSKPLTAVGDAECLQRLQSELIKRDLFMTLADFDDYIRVKNKATEDYEDRLGWAKKMLMNIANAGYFSSDRTISEYNKKIWKI